MALCYLISSEARLSDQKKKAVAGRKPLDPAGPGESVTIRLAPGLRGALQGEADASGHSLSREVETRLRGSLRGAAMAGAPLAVLLNDIIALCSMQTGEDWLRDAYTFDTVAAAVAAGLGAIRPKGDAVMPPRFGLLVAAPGVDALKDPAAIGALVAADCLTRIQRGTDAESVALKAAFFGDAS